MKLTTVTLPAIEMTKEEESIAYFEWYKDIGIYVEGSKIVDWQTDDGDNSLRLYGEDFYRLIVRPKA